MKCEICGMNDARHYHHIQSKSKGGNNKQENLCGVCPNCHDEVHRGIVVLEGKFLTTAGMKVIWHKKGETPITGMPLPEVYVMK